jgi:DNA-binding transcriptional LysR family regulator
MKRRIVLTVPNVLAVRRLVLGSDLIATIGQRIARGFASDPALVVAAPPVVLASWPLQLLTRRRRPEDDGLRWLTSNILHAGLGDGELLTRHGLRET